MASLRRILNFSTTEQAQPNKAAQSNEAVLPNGTASPNDPVSPSDPGQPKEPATPNRLASPKGPMSPGEPALLVSADSLPDRSGHGASTSEQPQSNTTDTKWLVHYNSQKWEYEGYEWLEPDILSLNLKPFGSNSASELVREAYIQHDNPDGLLRLWEAIHRPVYTPDPNRYEIFAVLRHREFKDKKGGKAMRLRVQWTGFSTSRQDTTWEAEEDVKQAAPEILNEYWFKRANRPAKISKRVDKAAEQPKRQRPQRQARQQR